MIASTLRTVVMAGLGVVVLATGAGCNGPSSASPTQPSSDALKKEAERQKQIHYREANNKP